MLHGLVPCCSRLTSELWPMGWEPLVWTKINSTYNKTGSCR